MKLSIIIPCYNEQLTIKDLDSQHIRKLRTMLDIWGFKKVDDLYSGTKPDINDKIKL